jgi:TolA-binding protein
MPMQENTAQLQDLHDQQLQSEQSIADLQTRLSDLEAEQTRHAETLTDFDQRLSEIEAEISARTQSLEALEQMQATLQSQSDETNIELDRQINLLKGMELLSRARLFMYQSNFGLARQDVQSARDLLATVRADAPDSLADDLNAVILRLELTLANLPDFPVAASDDLDIAWQILLGRLPPAQTLIASATPTPQATPTPSPEATVSVTPQVTPSPTATP